MTDPTHYPYPSITQLRSLADAIDRMVTFTGLDDKGEPVYDNDKMRPTIQFTGTVKLHGTNASIVFFKDGTIQYQSRERVIYPRPNEDNSEFAKHFDARKEKLLTWFADQKFSFQERVVLYGEWAGYGINKGAAINKFPRRFYIFACSIDGKWAPIDRITGDSLLTIDVISRFPMFETEINFNNPKRALDRLNELTDKIDKVCPVALEMGVAGPGEGIVWEGVWNDIVWRFKTKGETHSLKQKAAKPVELDAEKYGSVQEFLEQNLSTNRLMQGLQVMHNNNQAISMKNLGTFMQWCARDIFEECAVELKANNLDRKILGHELAKRAKNFYLDHVNGQFKLRTDQNE